MSIFFKLWFLSDNVQFFPILFKIRECLSGESHSRAIFNLIFLVKEKKEKKNPKQLVSSFRREHNFHMRISFYIPVLKSFISVTLLPTSFDYFLFLDNQVENRPSNPFIFFLHHSLSCWARTTCEMKHVLIHTS